MKKIISIVFLLAHLVLCAQNLVNNPSFEIYSTCPNNAGQINYADNWINPTTWGTPDYFNSCSSILNVPYCAVGGSCFQSAKTGNAYIGIYSWGYSVTNGREYIQIQLSSQLNIGKCYLTHFYINLLNRAMYATNNIGMYLSSNQISSVGSNPLLNYTPQILSFKNKIIKDTANWIKIEGIYTADGTENYITIGNFFNDFNTDTIKVNPTVPTDAAYYFIDDVSLTPIDSIGSMPANAGFDQNIAIGDSVFIGQQISNLNCNWYQLPGNTQIATNTSGIYVKPNSPTTYVVEQNLCGTITYDTVNVWVSPTKVNEYEKLQNSVTIFPNPNNGNVNLQFDKFKNIEIEVIVTDITGKEIYTANIAIKDNIANFNLDVKSGTYFIKISNANTKEQVIKKLVIQK